MIESYKETHLGKIPIDWEVVKLSKICDVRDGTHDSPKYVEDGIPFVTSKNLTDTVLSFDNIKYISNDDHYNFSKRSHVENGDILFGMIGTVGKPIIVQEKFEFSIKNVALLKFSDNKILNNIFAKNILKSSLVLNQFKKISNGGVLNFVALGNIRSLDFPLPPLPEQQKIAEILSTVDAKIEIIDQQITETQELKKGLMQRLLTKGIGHSEFKDSPLGKIPKSWEVVKINEVTSYVDYRGKTPPKVDSGILLVTARNIKMGKIDYEISKEFIPVELYDSVMSRGVPQIGDVLITTEAPLGNIASVDNENIALAQRVIKYRGNNDILDNIFLKQYMLGNVFQSLLEKQSTGSTVKGIKGSVLHKLNIVLPPIEEQQKIADILSSVDEKLEVLLEKKVNYQELKQGLMQQLLTGKIRVKV